MSVLTGAQLIGGNSVNGRVKDDWYCTNPDAVKMLFKAHEFKGNTYLEPCVGNGSIANAIHEIDSSAVIDAVDIADRGYPGTIIADFLEWDTGKKYSNIITNPPYSLANEFIYKCMDLLEDNGQMAMFLKIQFLEGVKRRKLFSDYPPHYVYVFRKRMDIWNNRQQVNPITGKRWANTICFAWYVWQKNYKGETLVKWID